jgi:DNA-binding NarL/FixJ family response regulator
MKKVLLVEDLPDAQAWLRRAIEEAFPGAEATVAASLDAARASLAGNPHDLALIDLGLPDGSGVDLVDELARTRPEITRVVATVFDDDGHLMAALRAGAQGYILKQQPQGQLIALLRGIEAGQPPLSPSIARRILAAFHRPDEPPELTAREREVLSLIARGYRIAEAADVLGLSRHTVHGYLKAVYEKLHVSSRAEATLVAVRQGIVDPG